MVGHLIRRSIAVCREEGVGAVACSSWRFGRLMFHRAYGERRHGPQTIRAISELPDELTPRQLFDFASASPANIIRPWQFPEEFLPFLNRVFVENKVSAFMEIGTLNGGSLFCFCRLAAPDAIGISADLPGGLFGGGWPKWKGGVFDSFRRGSQRLNLLRVDSHQSSTLDQVRSLLGGRELDFLFIDGDHSYEGAKQDMEMYSPLVRSGGFIGFHDIVEPCGDTGKGQSHLGVYRLWRELRSQYPYEEFISDPKRGAAGIGLIRKV